MDRLLKEKREEILMIAQQHGARNVRIIRADMINEEQVIIFLVDFYTEWSLLDCTRLLNELQTLLGCKVDVFAEQGLHWYVRDRVLADTTPL